MRHLVVALAGVLTLVGSARAEDGPLVGKPLPALELSHPLQGDAWTPEDLHGSIVLLDVFQLG